MATVDVWLTGGQSNMEGVGNGSEAPDCDPALCWEWDGGPGLQTVDDPGGVSEPYQAETGSMLPAFVNTITEATERPSVIVRAAVGGTSLLASNAGSGGDWSATGSRFGDSVTRATDALADIVDLGHTIAGVHVLWSQGHRDAQIGNDLGTYQAANEALVDRWRTALSEPTLKVYQELLSSTSATGSCGSPQPNFQAVRDAQVAAATNKAGLEMAFTEGPEYCDRGWLRWDGLHYNQTGLNYMGYTYASFIAVDLGLTPPPAPAAAFPVSLVAHRFRHWGL
jgi:hypothetical protein